MLQERVPIRQLGAILEALADWAPRSSSVAGLVERVRQRLARAICHRYRDAAGRLHVVVLEPELEDRIQAGLPEGEPGQLPRLPPG